MEPFASCMHNFVYYHRLKEEFDRKLTRKGLNNKGANDNEGDDDEEPEFWVSEAHFGYI